MARVKKFEELLKKAFRTGLAQGCYPEAAEDIQLFERRYNVKIPDAYAGLMKCFGVPKYGDPFLYSIKELHRQYPFFLEEYEQYTEDYDMPDLQPFPIGEYSDESKVFIDEKTGEVFALLYQETGDLPLKKIADSFEELMSMLAQAMIWVDKEMKKVTRLPIGNFK